MSLCNTVIRGIRYIILDHTLYAPLLHIPAIQLLKAQKCIKLNAFTVELRILTVKVYTQSTRPFCSVDTFSELFQNIHNRIVFLLLHAINFCFVLKFYFPSEWLFQRIVI